VIVAAFQPRKPAAIFIEPALATSIDKVPSGERWIHDQVRRLSRSSPSQGRRGKAFHASRQRLDEPLQKDRG
jgi:hypothetical protein